MVNISKDLIFAHPNFRGTLFPQHQIFAIFLNREFRKIRVSRILNVIRLNNVTQSKMNIELYPGGLGHSFYHPS